MAVTTKKLFPATSNATTTVFNNVGIQLNNQDDLDVYVTLSGGTRVLQLRQSTGSTAQSSHPQVNNTDGLYFPAVSAGTTLYNYQLSTDNNTITFNSALPQGAVVFCERRTRDADSSYTSFATGSTIRATDLNNSSTESNFTAQDGRNKALTIEGVLFDGDQPSTNFVTTDHIVNGTIVEADLANSAVTQNKLADNSVGTPELINGSVTTDKLANDNVTLAKLGGGALPTDITVASANIVNGTITTADIGGDQITNALIADNQIDSEHYVDGSIDHVHLANDIIDGDNIQDDVINSEHIVAGALDNEHYAAGSITSDKLNGATVVTNSEQSGYSVNDTSFFTTSAAEARYFNASTGETIKDGQTFPDNDTTIATTAAINDRIIDLVDDVGGFVPIANETSFPNANPDVNNGTGTIVSISTLASNHTSSGSGVITISNGTVGNSTVTINGAANSTTYSAGYGLLVETTTTLNTYTFHRLVPKATEVTTVAGKATEIGRLGTADAVADMAILGTTDVVADLNTLGTADIVADMNMLAVSDVISDMNTLAVTSVINDMDTVATNVANVNLTGGSIANVNTTAGSIANVNTVAGSIANVNTTAGAISNVNTTATNIASVNTTASNIANVNNFTDKYQIAANNPSTDGGGNALAAGDLYFNTSANELKVYNGSAWQAGVTATGNFALTTGNTFTGNNIFTAHTTHNDNVKALFGTGGDLQIYHSGTLGVIYNPNDNIKIISDTVHLQSNGGEPMLKAIENGAVELYYDNSKKFETTSYGAKVTGALIVGSSNDLQFTKSSNDTEIQNYNGTLLFGNASSNSNNVFIRGRADENSIVCIPDGAVQLYHDNSHKFSTNSGGISVYGSISASGGLITGADNAFVYTGAGNDLQLTHNGTDSYIKHATGSGQLQLRSREIEFKKSDATGTMAKFVQDGAVELYHNNSKKFQTNGAGVDVFENLYLADNVNLKFGTGADLQVYHDGSNSYVKDTGTGSLIVHTSNFAMLNAAANQNMLLVNEGADVQLYYNGSKKFETLTNGAKVSGHLFLVDNGKVKLGAGEDFEIYHDGTYNIIKSNNSHNIELQIGSNTVIKAGGGGEAQLLYSGSKKLETTSAGISVTGTHTATNYGSINLSASTSEVRWPQDGSASNSRNFNIIGEQGSYGVLDVKYSNARDENPNEKSARFIANGGVELYHNNVKQFETTNEGVLVTNLHLGDAGFIELGASDDLRIYHDGSHSYLYNLTGELKNRAAIWKVVNAANSEKMIVATENSSVDLYYDDSKKFETTANGAKISGTTAAFLEITTTSGAHNPMFRGSNGDQTFDTGLRGDSSDNWCVYDVTNSDNRFMIDPSGNVKIPNDSVNFSIGASNDLQLYHDGSNSHIANSTGYLLVNSVGNNIIRSNANVELQPASGETAVKAIANGGVELYHNNGLKFFTGANGIYFPNHGTLHEKAIHFDTSGGGDYATLFGVTNYPDASGYGDQNDGHWARIQSKGGCVIVINSDGGRNDGRNTYDHFSVYHKAGESTNGKRAFSVDHTGGVQFGQAGIKIDREWGNQPSISVQRNCNDGTNNTDDSAYFRIHGTGKTHESWTGGSDGNDFSVNLIIDGGTYATSDRRAKTDIVDCPYGLDVVNKLQPRKYQLVNSQLEKQGDDNINLGFIAQEIKEHIPECVNYLGDEADKPNEKGYARAYALEIGEVIPVLTKAIQELSAQVETLKTKIAALEAV